MDCTGRWTEKTVACKWTTTDCETSTHFTGHDPFEQVVWEYFAHRRGAPGLEPICSHILHRSISPTRLVRCTRSRTPELQRIVHGRKRGRLHGTEWWSANSEWQETKVETRQTCVGRHGRQAHFVKARMCNGEEWT